MSERATQPLDTADEQIGELIDLLSVQDEAALRLPCPGREKLGDGTIGALALHTADNYLRIAEFLQNASEMSAAHTGGPRRRHWMPRFLRAHGHTPRNHDGDHDQGTHPGDYTARNIHLADLLMRLSTARDALSLCTQMTDEHLHTVPPAGSFRFCDGQRTLEQVINNLLNHQRHQLDALKTGLAQ